MKPTRKPPPPLSDQIRALIARRPSLYALAEESGVDRGVLSRFMRNERGLTTATLDRLAEALRLRISAGR